MVAKDIVIARLSRRADLDVSCCFFYDDRLYLIACKIVALFCQCSASDFPVCSPP